MNTATGPVAAWLLVALPALSAPFLLLLGKRANKWGHLLGALVPVALFVYAVILFFSIKAETGHGRVATCTCSAGCRSAASTSTSAC